MEDYEATAFDLVEQLKKRQAIEIEELRDRVTHEYIKGHRWPKDIIDTRKQEKIFHSVKDYDKAEAAKRFADQLEEIERENMKELLEVKLNREIGNIQCKQQLQI